MNLKDIVNKFNKQSILVVGDTMVDKFIWGNVKRISPEAPVPVVEVVNETEVLGGAGNVAANIIALGAKANIVSSMGNDHESEVLVRLLEAKNIPPVYMVEDISRPTIIKTRIIAANQQVCRVDKEIKGGVAANIEDKIIKHIKTAVEKSDGVIISDYGKGVVGKEVLKAIISMCNKKGIPVSVDPKLDNFAKYKGVTTITPNTKEAIEGMHARNVETDEDLMKVGRDMLSLLESDSVLITRSEKGMMLIKSGGDIINIPTRAKEVYDVTGAGDTVISVLTLALAAGADILSAAEIANFAAGVVVGKRGTATASAEEVISVIEDFYK